MAVHNDANQRRKTGTAPLIIKKIMSGSLDYMWTTESEGMATVGITNEAQRRLGDIVYVDLPHPGVPVRRDETMGTVESVKSVSDLISPVTGLVTAVNPLLADSPELLNTDPEGTAWLVKVKLSR
jgi:glycine cleavage system H protein